MTAPLTPRPAASARAGRRAGEEEPGARARRARVALAVCLACTLVPCSAYAQEPARLVYEIAPGAESCGGEKVLRAAVTHLLGYDPFSPTASRTVWVRLQLSDGEFSGSVRLVEEGVSATEERTVRAARCDDVVLAVALTASVALDPARAFAPPRGSAPTSPTPTPTPMPTPSPELPPKRAALPTSPTPPIAPTLAPPPTPPAVEPLDRAPAVARRSGGWIFSSGAGVSLSSGDVPAPALGASGYFALDRGLLAGELDARFVSPGSVRTPEGTASAWSVELEAAPCIQLVLFLGCALAQAAVVDAHGEVASSRHAAAVVGRAGARAGLVLPIARRFEVRLVADGLLNMSPIVLRLAGVDVYRYAPGVVRLTLAAGVRF